MKPLTDLAVLQAAEELMLKHGQTTTLDVKQLLRQQNFEALQNEVSSRMENLCRQEAWQTNSAGAYRIYSLGADTDQKFLAYWELEAEKIFWELKIEKHEAFIVTGRIGTDGQMQTLAYRTNREAIRQGLLLMHDKRKEGYKPAQDTRLPLAVRQHFSPHADKIPATIRLAYYGVKQACKREGLVSVNGKELSGIQEAHIQGGYEFEWNLPADKAQLQHVWAKDVWSPLYYQILPVACLGEQTQYNYLVEGTPVSNVKLVTETEWQPTHFFEVSKALLFQARLTFEDGTVLRINRYDSLFANTHKARQPSPLFWSAIQRFLI